MCDLKGIFSTSKVDEICPSDMEVIRLILPYIQVLLTDNVFRLSRLFRDCWTVYSQKEKED